jgi:type III secretion protein J
MATARLLSLVLLAALLGGCRTQIHHGLEEREANELQTVLQDAGIDARKVAEKGKRPTWAVEVPGGEATRAVRLLDALELPRPRLEGVARVLSSSGLVPSASEERLKELHLLSEQAALALQRVDGVSSAHVQLSLPPPPRPGQPRAPAKAAALVRVRPGAMDRVAPLREELRALVAGGVDGLSADAVEVVLQETARPPPPAAPPSGTARAQGLAVLFGLLCAGAGACLATYAPRLRGAAPRAPPAERASTTSTGATPARPVVAPSARRVA